MKLTWFSMKANAVDTTATDISLHDEIGIWGVSASEFIREFKAIDTPNIKLTINSPGGNFFDGLAIHNTLKNSGKNIDVEVIGIAASAASLVAMAGTTIRMPENTYMMVHNPMGGVMGNADDMREMAEMLDKFTAGVTSTYAARTGQTPEEIMKLMNAETVMSAKEAKAKGFADEVTASRTVKASFDLDKLPVTMQAAFKQEPAPVVVAVSKLDAAQIEAAAKAAGFEKFAMVWALDETLYEPGALETQIAVAKETKLLCTLCKRPEATDLFIEMKTSLKDVRAKLQDSLASKDESQTIDTALKITNPQNPVAPKQPSMVIDSAYVDSVYASRKANRS